MCRGQDASAMENISTERKRKRVREREREVERERAIYTYALYRYMYIHTILIYNTTLFPGVLTMAHAIAAASLPDHPRL